MSSPIQPNKTYGVLHTESFFSFVGFAKKIGSDETQKIDIYLDDKLMDTIKADKFIQKLDNMYDVENQAFSYNLPVEYIGKKAKISFRNHNSQEELLNSPYSLIDKNHEDFNEAKFMHSLSEPINEELKNMYKANSIGFLATKENLEDEEFVGYIKELMIRFPDVEFKGFYFDNKAKNNTFLGKTFTLKPISSIPELIKEIEILIWDFKSHLDLDVVKYLLKYSNNTFNVFNFKNPYFINLDNLSLRNYDDFYKNRDEIIIKTPEEFGFTKDEINLYKDSYVKLMYEALIRREDNEDYILDINQSALEFLQFEQINLAFKYKNFKKNHIKIHKIRNAKLNR
ncbi:hypothetical protein [Aliarcobacter butzleri]|uniref:hypothetical protein n=1 Tax=Aliarcobacter butzleri TaxID=28197 RepID=UPI001EDB08D1|nr:hypothetical protein [Aliarcobacter butzleri]MCG3685609.1 hypothetical protein [Aliarcobacter butzleri]MCT7562665.1 hypothetical protein [Aliarcobacter butzleri]MCT7637581.1 hypothetical protein [Aliarcobacter butzleri]